MGPPSYMRSVVNRNVVMLFIPVVSSGTPSKRCQTTCLKTDEDRLHPHPSKFVIIPLDDT